MSRPPDHDRPFVNEAEAQKAWSDAVVLAKQGHYATSLAIFLRLANDGYCGAAYVVGYLFECGIGDVPRDLQQAEIWYERTVAEGDDEDARYDLARVILCRSTAFPGSVESGRINFALGLLEDLASSGNPYAAIHLGSVYLEGRSVPRDLEYASVLLERAADRGFVIAFVQLSRIALRKGSLLGAVLLRLKAAFRALVIMFHNVDDRRLFLMHRGVRTGSEEFPGWKVAQKWERFGNSGDTIPK